MLLVKADLWEYAHDLFAGTNIQIVTHGTRYLGSAIGEPVFVRSFLRTKVTKWMQELERLATFAHTEPHAAYAALTHGLRGRWPYIL